MVQFQVFSQEIFRIICRLSLSETQSDVFRCTNLCSPDFSYDFSLNASARTSILFYIGLDRARRSAGRYRRNAKS